jgi:hypothetical protein
VFDFTEGNDAPTANATEANKSRRAEGSLPLPSDVVGLISHASRNVGIRTGCDEENTEITNTLIVVEALCLSVYICSRLIASQLTMIGNPIRPTMAFPMRIGPRT